MKFLLQSRGLGGPQKKHLFHRHDGQTLANALIWRGCRLVLRMGCWPQWCFGHFNLFFQGHSALGWGHPRADFPFLLPVGQNLTLPNYDLLHSLITITVTVIIIVAIVTKANSCPERFNMVCFTLQSPTFGGSSMNYSIEKHAKTTYRLKCRVCGCVRAHAHTHANATLPPILPPDLTVFSLIEDMTILY